MSNTKWILGFLFVILIAYIINSDSLYEGYSGRRRGGHGGSRRGGHGGSRRGGHGRSRRGSRSNMRLNYGPRGYGHSGYGHSGYGHSGPRHHRRWWNSWYRQNPVYYYDDVAPEVYMYPTYQIAKPTQQPRSFYEDFVNFIRWIFGYPPI